MQWYALHCCFANSKLCQCTCMSAGEHELAKLFEGNDYYQGFKLTLADSMLAKEKLDAALK